MSYAIEFNNVWKKFKMGERFNSLRDAVPVFMSKIGVMKANTDLEQKEFWAVKDVSFKLEKGGVIGIMGPNGAGKSTILKLLSRILVPNKGDMKVNGRLSALIEVTAGFHPELTGRENVYLNGTILGMRRKEIDLKFDEIVDFSGVEKFIDTPVKRYSSGMYSRLGFSVAAHMDPEILLVDEVLSVGDMAFKAKCAQKIRELLTSGVTIILVSHHLHMIQSLCKRVILLQNGAIIRDGAVSDVIPHYQNIVFKNAENKMMKKMSTLQSKIKVDTRRLVNFADVHIRDEKNQDKEGFKTGENIEIELEYSAREMIESPVFMCEIVRADGVLCCFSRSDEAGINIDAIEGKGKIKINLNKTLLNSGVYMAKLSIWDKEMIHPYVVRNKDIIRIEFEGKGEVDQSSSVFVHPVKWEIKGS